MRLFLLTGFLGAGKTTLLKNMIHLLHDEKLAVIVNEFGREGVDGPLLAGLGIAVDEINNGSIFCSCRLDAFEAALRRAIAAEPETILVEASGLSDPGSLEKILSQDTFSSIHFAGSLCVVDALNFKRVVDTVRVCKKQLAISRTILLNKTDLVDESFLLETEERIRALRPDAILRRTQFCEVQLEWLDAMQNSPSLNEQTFQTKELGLQKRLIRLKETMRLYQLQKFLEMFAEDTHRIKGVVHLENQNLLVDCVGPRISLCPWEGPLPDAINYLVVLAGPSLPLSKSLAQAAEWYQPHILSIESGT